MNDPAPTRSALRLCPRCGWFAHYNSHFRAVQCRQCGWSESGARTQRTATVEELRAMRREIEEEIRTLLKTDALSGPRERPGVLIATLLLALLLLAFFLFGPSGAGH